MTEKFCSLKDEGLPNNEVTFLLIKYTCKKVQNRWMQVCNNFQGCTYF